MTPRHLSLKEALAGSSAPAEILSQLTIISVPFIDFSGQRQTGQLVVNQALAHEVTDIFGRIAKLNFPIEKMQPIVHYDWDDQRSMADNNTSCFNYREITGTGELSFHATGRAIDINPRTNPYHGYHGVEPVGATYNVAAQGALLAHSPVVEIFESYGWTWLGYRPEHTDYQHFHKPAPLS
ncbi:MAG TPA: M15 family metallopeptidase [Candidatus Saccharimonadia bacterium]|jgi:hypothetical protein|nr:M15 family metallopeptidase [Candidatus Saccharimonadia bacterium]